uniref:Anillin domain-containing protein n=1 Tax=Mesocestoides corti TaxID=53468 RepID=A0A5K3F683_MESCO
GAVFFNRPAKFKFSLRLFCRSQLSTPDFLVEMTKLPRQNTMSKDPKLQEDIERNLKLREGASRILAMAANNIQRLDAAKTILVSNARLVVSMQQLQREKTSEANAAARGQVPSLLSNSTNHFCTGKATLCLSDLRIPLLWKDTTLTPNSSVTLAQVLDPGYLSSSPAPSGYSSATLSRQRPLSAVISMATAGALTGGDVAGEAYSAFCIVRVADQVRETRLLCDVFPGSADLEFDDVLTFKNIGPDFECTIEVYGSQPFCGQNGSAFLRRKSQIDSISAANRNSIFLGTLTPEYTKVSKSGQRGAVSAHSQIADCCFTLVARYSARLSDLSSGVSAHALEFLLTPSHHPSQSGVNSLLSIPAFPTNDDILPLFGPICFRMSAQPDSAHKSVRQGLLWIRTLNASPKQEVAQLYFCELRNQRLYARLVKSKDRSALIFILRDILVSLRVATVLECTQLSYFARIIHLRALNACASNMNRNTVRRWSHVVIVYLVDCRQMWVFGLYANNLVQLSWIVGKISNVSNMNYFVIFWSFYRLHDRSDCSVSCTKR